MRLIHKALGISLLIHLAIAISLAIVPFIVAKKRYTPVYQVSLVTQPEPKPKKAAVQLQKKKLPEPKPKKALEPKPKKVAVQPQKKKLPVKKPTRVEKKAIPSKKKKEEVKKRDTQKEQSAKRVQRAIDEIKKKMVSRQRLEEEHLRTSRIIETRRNAYFDTIAAHIQANWSLLKNQMEDLGTLTTDIGLQIQRDGTITKIVIEKPSGNALFDEYAVRAVKRSTPLPPFPTEVRESRLEVTVGLSS